MDLKGIMMTKRLSRDSSDDEDIPLKFMKINGYEDDPNCYDSLCRHSIEACEFCDRLSSNRYSSLIHNMKHIIIPLLNQTVYQCEVCLHHFVSEQDLTAHKLIKHPWNTIPKVNLVKFETMELFEPVHRDHRESSSDSVEIIEDESQVASIKSRLLFEDDDEHDLKLLNCDQLLNDLITGCKVNLEVFETPWLVDDEFKGRSVHYDDLVKPGVYICKKCGKGFPIRYEAIIHEASHIYFKNSQLNLCVICNTFVLGDRNNLRLHYLSNHKVKPTENQNGQTYLTTFVDFIDDMNRKEQLKRAYEKLEAEKIMKKSAQINNSVLKKKTVQSKEGSSNNIFCDNKEDDLKQIICVNEKDSKGISVHKIIFSNDTEYPETKIDTEQEMDSKQNVFGNGKNNIINKIVFSTDKNDLGSVENESIFKSSLMLCDLCYSFSKSKKYLNYVCVGELREPGKRYQCQKCKSIFIHIKLVKREISTYCKHTKKKHHKSNKERLDNIRNRFKKLKM